MKEPLFLVEMSQSQIEGIISALDSVVKTNGLGVAEKCAQIYNTLLAAQPKVEPVIEPEVEEVSLEEVEDELEQIMEVPKKRKRSTRKKK
ncbi:MAG: hypothetical protein CMP21_03825 [Rickettsiales bacterium]|nr:hypothetical protein [Rickettsiales bacterium]|tara:strand:- start:32597 stop:32866 length:270 start_codon:yes stop_codon:yes gene_type:complete